MTLYEYRALDELEQTEALWEHGVHIGEREEGEYKVVLYQIFEFYIEVFYHIEHNVIHRYKAFSNTELLDAYLDKYNLKDLGL
jgi:hypothetical protein